MADLISLGQKKFTNIHVYTPTPNEIKIKSRSVYKLVATIPNNIGTMQLDFFDNPGENSSTRLTHDN